MRPAEALRVASVPLRAPQLASVLGLPRPAARTVRWGLVIPTRVAMREFMDRTIDAALAEEEVGLVKRVLMAPILAWARGKAVDALHAQCQLEAFRRIVQAQPGWDKEDRQRVLRPYVARLETLMVEELAVPVPDGMALPAGGHPIEPRAHASAP
jgi:hypothetical protein